MTQNRLPDFSYSYKLDCNSNFNNLNITCIVCGYFAYFFISKITKKEKIIKIKKKLLRGLD